MIHILHPEVKEMIDKQAQAIQRVRELHTQQSNTLPNSQVCAACYDNYPCPTIKALDGEQ